MRKIKGTWFSDPGHGWLRVLRAECVALGIVSQISQHSYQKGQYVYLEEDCDAPLFTDKAKEGGFVISLTERVPTNNSSSIRGYEPFAVRGSDSIRYV